MANSDHSDAASDAADQETSDIADLEVDDGLMRDSKVTRAFLAQVIGDRIGLSNNLCNDLVIHFFDTIKQALIDGKTVKIQNFATFNLRSKNARPGRNPKTGEEVEVSARRVVTFKPSRKLRNLVDSRGTETET